MNKREKNGEKEVQRKGLRREELGRKGLTQG